MTCSSCVAARAPCSARNSTAAAQIGRIGGGILDGAGVGDRLDLGVDDQQRDVNAALA